MRINRSFSIFLALGRVLGTSSMVMGQEPLFKGYNVVVVQDLDVPSGSPAPESAGLQMAEKAIQQIKRYSERYRLFDIIAKEGGKASKEIPHEKKILIIKGEVKEYSVPTTGRRIGRHGQKRRGLSQGHYKIQREITAFVSLAKWKKKKQLSTKGYHHSIHKLD